MGAVISEGENRIVQRNKMPIANIFFKFAHTDQPCALNGNQLTKITNHYQELVVTELIEIINKQKKAMEAEPPTDFTSTFIAYYDTIVEKNLKNDLVEVRMDNLTKSLVQNNLLRLREINQIEDAKDQELKKNEENPKKQKVMEA